ncbi:unnamed protein product, partial [marine sediment metagenome]
VSYLVAVVKKAKPSRQGLADLSGDGRVNFEDFMLFSILNWNRYTDEDLSRLSCLVDFDADGRIGVPDLLELARLNHYRLTQKEMVIRAIILRDFPLVQSLLDESLRSNPNDPELNLYMAVARIINLVESPAADIPNLLVGFGAVVDLFPQPILEFPDPLPFDSPDVDDVFDVLKGDVLTEVNAALANLDKAKADPNLQLMVSLDESGTLELDIADVYLTIAGLQSLLYRINYDLAYDWNTDIDAFQAGLTAESITVESFLNQEENFGNLRATSSFYLLEAS